MTVLQRAIDPVLLAAMTKPVWFPIAFAFIDWPATPLRLHSKVGPVNWDGHVWTGAGHFGEFNIPAEDGGLVPQEADLSLNGDWSDLLIDVDTDAAGRSVQIWIGATENAAGTTLVGTPNLAFVGSITNSRLDPSRSGQSALTISVRAGTHGRVSGVPKHTDELHTSVHPGDTLFSRQARASSYAAAPPVW